MEIRRRRLLHYPDLNNTHPHRVDIEEPDLHCFWDVESENTAVFPHLEGLVIEI
jgi:hypothetical protein